MMLPPDDYMGMYDARAGMHPGLSASLASLHPFFPHSLLPEAPLSEDDISLFMLLVTYSDALDALPLEATRSFSDLRELDAVLGGTYTCLSDATLAHLGSLTHRLYHLATILENPDATPGERLLALKDVADEARSYKMGGEDKIRVASNTTDMVGSAVLTCRVPRTRTISTRFCDHSLPCLHWAPIFESSGLSTSDLVTSAPILCMLSSPCLCRCPARAWRVVAWKWMEAVMGVARVRFG